MLLRDATDDWVFSNGDPAPVDRSQLVGLFMPSYNNVDIIRRALDSLIKGMPDGYSFGLIVVDGGSTDGTVKAVTDNYPFPVVGPHMGMAALQQPAKNVLNVAAELWLGPYDRVTNKFAQDDRMGYLGFIHTDGLYDVQQGWLKVLTDICQADPTIGCLGPWHYAKEPANLNNYSWNPPMFVLPLRTLRASYQRYGWWIDPNFWAGTAFCDWDMGRRFMGELGLKVEIAPKSKIIHLGNGSRATLCHTVSWWARNNNENRNHYVARWGTTRHPWE